MKLGVNLLVKLNGAYWPQRMTTGAFTLCAKMLMKLTHAAASAGGSQKKTFTFFRPQHFDAKCFWGLKKSYNIVKSLIFKVQIFSMHEIKTAMERLCLFCN